MVIIYGFIPEDKDNNKMTCLLQSKGDEGNEGRSKNKN